MYLEIIATISVLLVTSFFYFRNKRKNLPPYNSESILKTLSIITGSQLPEHLLRWYKDLGPVFVTNLPEPVVMIADVTIARLLLEGDKDKNIRQGEKLKLIKRMIPNRIPRLFNRYTYKDNWDMCRLD